MATEELTEREREMLGHLRKAQELGSTLVVRKNTVHAKAAASEYS